MLLLIDQKMTIRCAFHPAVQCQTSRAMHFGKKGIGQIITRTISNIYTYTLIGDINITKVKIHDSKPRDRRKFYTSAPIF